VHRVVTGAAVELVGAVVAGELVGDAVPGGVDGARAGEFDVLDARVGGEINGDRRTDGVIAGAAAVQLVGLVADVVDDIDVIGGAPAQAVGAGAPVQRIVADAADEVVGAAVAFEAVGAIVAGRREGAHAEQHRVLDVVEGGGGGAGVTGG